MALDTPQRLALSPSEAAYRLGVSRDFFDMHIKPDLRVIRRGRLVLVPVRELEQWMTTNAARTISDNGDQSGSRRERSHKRSGKAQ